MNAHDRQDFDNRVAALAGRVTALSFHPRLERVLAEASGVVAMGGYNTFCEILSMDKPAIISPRTSPRREQVIRAEAAEELGLLRMLLSERDGNSAQVMVTAIRALATQRRPSEACIPGLLSGLSTIADRMAEATPAFAVAGE
jgi:predicted glycosyltransferase